MDLATVMQRLAIALGLGLLVGLQRERTKAHLGGVRTFPLLTLFGTLCGLLALQLGGWVVAAGVVGVAALLLGASFIASPEEPPRPGITTEIAALLMFCVGAYLVFGYVAVAVAVGGGVAVLLEFKGQIHGLAKRLADVDVTAIMRFVLLSLVILPALPDQTYGPYAVLNPRKIWLMIVLIVGLSLAGYLVYKFFGKGAGIVLGGVLGGMISSTATTVSYAKRAREAAEATNVASLVIVIASTVVFARLLVEIAAAAPSFLATAAPPLGALLVVMVGLSAGLWFWNRGATDTMPEQENPTELKSALFFGGAYAVVLLAVAAAKEYFGSRGLYVVAGISGLTDVDAITLSTSQLVGDAKLEASVGWRVITVAVLSNLVFKAGTIAALGNRQLFVRVAMVFGVALLAGVLVLSFWPDSVAIPAP